MQQAAAQHNNRGFVLKCLENILAGEPAKIESLSVSSISEASIGQIEMTEGLPFEEEAPFELNNPSAFHYELPQVSPLRSQMPNMGFMAHVPVRLRYEQMLMD